VLLAISEDSREGVDATLGKALTAGAKEPRDKQDYGWMYYRAFEDFDGHSWEVMWMDAEAARKAMGKDQAA
jgi:predicted lactoylglutathione lyase